MSPADLLPATLAGYCRVRLLHDSYPLLVPSPGSRVTGAVFDLQNAHEFERVRFFEADEYEFATCTVDVLEQGPAEVLFCAEANMPSGALGEWHLARWQAQHKRRYLRQATRFMACFGHMSAIEADRYWHDPDAADDVQDLRIARG